MWEIQTDLTDKRYISFSNLGFPGGSDGTESARNAGNLGLIPGLGRCPGGEHGDPLQYSCLGIPQGVDKGLSFFTLYTHILFACFKVLNNQVLWQKIFTKIPHSPNKYTCVYCTPGIMLEAGNTAVKWQTRFTVHTPYHTPGQIFTKQLRATTHSRRHTLRFPASPSDLTLTSSSKRET